MIFIKHVRNKVKSYYDKGPECYICGSEEKLEFHHLLCLSTESLKLLRKEGYLKYPDETDLRFDELVWKIARNPDIMNPEYFYTLCGACHKDLHKVYGQNYTAWKPVKAYIDRQRVKKRVV